MAPYRPRAGYLEPVVLPSVCIGADPSDGMACRIGVHHRRARKTGPAFPIVVLRCHAHGRAFTLYPAGHFPYGRAALAPVGPEGELRWVREADEAPRLAWMSTLFAAAFVLSRRRRTVPARSEAWWATEPAEGLAEAAALLGLDGALGAAAADAHAEALGVARLTLLDATRDYAMARGPDARAAVVRRVLEQLPTQRCMLDRLLGAGAVAGLWGRVERWEPASGGARRRPFRVFPGRGSPAG